MTSRPLVFWITSIQGVISKIDGAHGIDVICYIAGVAGVAGFFFIAHIDGINEIGNINGGIVV